MQLLLARFNNIANKGQDLALLFMRLILAYGLYEPAVTKWSDINSVAEWFSSIGIFAPRFNAYAAATVEMSGVFLLLAGLGTRFICIPLIATMMVAIKTVHWANGFSSSENGFEIPLYFLLMLLVLLSFGSGRISVDYLIKKLRN